LVEEHARETNSRFAAMLLHDWETERDRFWQVVPKEYLRYLPVPLEAPQALRA
jgi:glutamate synthase (NADPH/NADH) large chain